MKDTNFTPMVLIVLAVTGLLYAQSGSGPSGPGAIRSAVAAALTPTPAATADVHCALDAKCVLASHLSSSVPRLDTETEELWANHCGNLQYLIALVPDPVDAHVGWLFDPIVDVIQRAAEAGGYSLDRFKLPWSAGAVVKTKCGATPSPPDQSAGATKNDEKGTTTCEALTNETEPGVLLFRHQEPQQAPLVVFLVGETPTSGVHKPALARALDLASCRRETISILGPTFSGSARSLAFTLQQWLSSSASAEWRRSNRDWREEWSSWSEEPLPAIRVISGSASSFPDQELQNVGKTENGANAVRFAATVIPDTHTRQQFIVSYLENQLGISPDQIALLIEGNTSYGLSLKEKREVGADARQPPIPHVLELPFPMQIAAVRSASEKAKPKPNAGADLLAVARPRLGLSLDDSREPPDLVPQMFPQITGPAVELVLDSIIATVSRREIKYVGLLATDVRDKVFLAQEIKRYNPDVRLFTFESDLMLAHPDYRQALTGMLVVSTYPLFNRTQAWTGPDWSHRLPFASSAAEGIYNATLALLGEGTAWFMVDYGMPKVGGAPLARKTRDRQPPLWISAVGNGGLWPLAIGDTSGGIEQAYLFKQRLPWGPLDKDGSDSDSSNAVAEGDDGLAKTLPEAGSARSAEIAWLLLSLLCLMQGVRYGIATTAEKNGPGGGSAPGDDRRLQTAIFRPRRQRKEQLAYVLVRFGTLLVMYSCVAFLFYFRSEVYRDEYWSLSRLLIWMCFAALLAPFVDAGVRLTARIFGWEETDRKRLWLMALLVATVIVTAGAITASVRSDRVWTFLGSTSPLAQVASASVKGSSPINRGKVQFMLDYERIANLQSQLSPLVPLILVGAIWFLWTHCHLRRLWLLENCTVVNPLQSADDLGGAGFERAQKDIDRALRHPFTGFPTLLGWLWIAPSAALWLRWLPTFEGTRFDWGFTIAFFLGSLGVVLAFAQTFAVWAQINWLLRRLASHPMVEAYTTLPERVSRGVRDSMYAYSPSVPDHELALEGWHALARKYRGAVQEAIVGRLELSAPLATELSGAMTTELHLADEALARALEGGYRGDTVAVRGALVDRFARLTAVLARVLTRAWREGKIAKRSSKEESPQDGAWHKPSGDPVTPWLAGAEGLVAIQVTTYLGQAFRHLRNFLGFVTVGLLLILLTVPSYPFQPQRLLTMFAWVLVLMIVTGALYVSVQMNRSQVLSYITGSKANALTFDRTFVLALITYGAIPVFSLLATFFPGIGDSLFSWIEPALRSVR